MRRYLLNGSAPIIGTRRFDALIIGAGIAGLYAALNLDSRLSCAILAKEGIDISNSWLAQGGIAAAVAKGDRPRLHFEDTIAAGAGLCDEQAVRVLVDEGPGDIATLVELNVPFDLNPDGDLQISREGGHRLSRVVHAHGDATGRETVKTLAALAAQRPNITLMENAFLVDILTREGRAVGALIEQDGCRLILARSIILCTGGIGQIYPHSTNPSVATGDGLAAALRAGAALKHMEFVQFHPTGLYSNTPESRAFLISEALRGEGAVLLNGSGRRFMADQHPMAELAPRDIVARGIAAEMHKSGVDHVYLDITRHTAEYLSARFPTIYAECLKRGIDISRDYIPVCPVQHYMMGGIATDLNGMSTLPGLYACGEAACTGVHGANRLASNSMLECLVFGRRAARHISGLAEGPLPDPADCLPAWENGRGRLQPDPAIRERIRAVMGQSGGIIRRRQELLAGLRQLETVLEQLDQCVLNDKERLEAYNMTAVAAEILRAALQREQSAGAHYRED